MRGLSANVLPTVIIINNHKGNYLLYSLSISSSWYKKWKMGTFLMHCNLFIMNCDFVFVSLVNMKSHTKLKLNMG